MDITTLPRVALVFAIFNLAGISFLLWLSSPLFAYLLSGPPYWPGITLSIAFAIFVVAVNVFLSMRAFRLDRSARLSWLMAGWTGVSAIFTVLLGASTPWAVAHSLVMIARMLLR